MVTVCADHPPPGPLPVLAAEFHDDCWLGPDAVAVRRGEDTEAVAMIGGQPCWHDVPDAVYRLRDGQPLHHRGRRQQPMLLIAAIRAARMRQRVLLLEEHADAGGAWVCAH